MSIPVTETFEHFNCSLVRQPAVRFCFSEDCTPTIDLSYHIACISLACDDSVVFCESEIDWKNIDYECTSCNIKSYEVTQEMYPDQQCLGSTVKSRGQIKLCNTDGYWSQTFNNEFIDEGICIRQDFFQQHDTTDCAGGCGGCLRNLRHRDRLPVILSQGFKCPDRGYEELVPALYGFTDKLPVIEFENGANACATLSFVDWIQSFEEHKLTKDILLINPSTGDIIEALLADANLQANSQVDQGRFGCPVFFAKEGDCVGDILPDLVQSEDGIFYQEPFSGDFIFNDDQFIDSTPQNVFFLADFACCTNPAVQCSNIMEINTRDIREEIDEVTVKWKEKGITRSNTKIFESPLTYWIDANSCRTETYNSAEGILSISSIQVEANRAFDCQGNDMTSFITTSWIQVDATTFEVTYCNSANTPTYICNTVVFGQEVYIKDSGEVTIINDQNTIPSSCTGTNSKVIDVDNVCSVEQAAYLARKVMARRGRSLYAFNQLEVTIKAIPNLSINDVVLLYIRLDNSIVTQFRDVFGNPTNEPCCDQGCFQGYYCITCFKITKITTILDGNCYRQKLRLIPCTSTLVDRCFIACSDFQQDASYSVACGTAIVCC